ncbi:MAG: copper amine oxidase N-terminal domain-containing protein [Firmicutes bacterium]|nr:copper amine oxidase N-terminal domain-containing protein [Bacillota bacterium]
MKNKITMLICVLITAFFCNVCVEPILAADYTITTQADKVYAAEYLKVAGPFYDELIDYSYYLTNNKLYDDAVITDASGKMMIASNDVINALRSIECPDKYKDLNEKTMNAAQIAYNISSLIFNYGYGKISEQECERELQNLKPKIEPTFAAFSSALAEFVDDNSKSNHSQVIDGGIIVNGRTMFPVRGVFEALGFNVEWNAEEKKAVISNSEHTVSLISGMKWFRADGKEIYPDVPQQLINNKLYLPLRAISDAIGASTTWDADTKTVRIMYKNTAVTVNTATGTVTQTQPPTTSQTSPKQTAAQTYSSIKAAIDSGDYSAVTPSFKKAMDSYEQFFDEYIAFMKKYENSNVTNYTAMLNDYTNYMNRYAKAMQDMENLKNTQMTTADSIYYVIVTTRIQTKLAALY